MSTLIQLDNVPEADRIDFFREMTASVWVPMECRPDPDADYRATFRASGLGPMQVVVMEVMPTTVDRTPRLISQADPDMLKMLLVCGGGASAVAQGGQQARLSAGDLVAVRIPATSGVGELTSQFLLQLARNIDSYTPADAARLATAALEILAARLAHELDIRDWGPPETRRHAQLTAVQGFIQQYLGDPGLSPAAIAAAHHMSLRSLHQLFNDEGLTVAGWIRLRRLERCRSDLADPALAARPVAAIAARWGFSSASDFSRAFRAGHGVPPAEYRRSARVVNGSAR